jgi:hypothetical protein
MVIVMLMFMCILTFIFSFVSIYCVIPYFYFATVAWMFCNDSEFGFRNSEFGIRNSIDSESTIP